MVPVTDLPTLTAPEAPSASQRAVTPCQLAQKDEALLSQAVLRLPWSGNERWERRWEQVAWRKSGNLFCSIFSVGVYGGRYVMVCTVYRCKDVGIKV